MGKSPRNNARRTSKCCLERRHARRLMVHTTPSQANAHRGLRLRVNSLTEQTMQTQIGGLGTARVQHSTYPEEKEQRLTGSRPVRPGTERCTERQRSRSEDSVSQPRVWGTPDGFTIASKRYSSRVSIPGYKRRAEKKDKDYQCTTTCSDSPSFLKVKPHTPPTILT